MTGRYLPDPHPYALAPLDHFSTLPDEIIINIIKFVRVFSDQESTQIRQRKWKRVIEISKTDKQPYSVYRNSQGPILNSLQSLGVVNKNLHKFCRPILWRVGRISKITCEPLIQAN